MRYRILTLSARGLVSAGAITLIACSSTAYQPSQLEQYSLLPTSNYAGQKAGLACSGVFVSGRSLDDILVDELGGTLSGASRTKDPVIDYEGMSASVEYDDDEMPRIAVYRRGRGCTILPPGSSADRVTSLPNPEIERLNETENTGTKTDDSIIKPSAALSPIIAAAFDGQTYGKDTRTIGIVIMHHGEIVAEHYGEGFGPHTQYRVWSAAKMLTNAVVGVLIGKGYMELDAPPPIPEWASDDDPRGKITVEHLLHMSSGLEMAGAGAYSVYHNGEDMARVTTSAKLEREPGTFWSYGNRDTLLLVRAMRSALGDAAYWRFPIDEILAPLGMDDTVLESDAYGNYVLSSQIYSTPRDMALLGQLFLQDGVWDGKRILPEGWVDFTIKPAPMRKRGIAGLIAYGFEGVLDYGAQVWLHHPIPLLISHNAFNGIGHRGQYVTVIPSEDLVVVRTALDSEVEGAPRWRQDKFFRDVIEARNRIVQAD